MPPRSSRAVIGLVPAAGTGSRIGRLPCSKEVLPIGLTDPESEGPRVACEFLLGAMRDAGVDRAYLILRKGKWDIPGFLGDGHELGLSLGYLMMREPHGVPYTLNQAHSFVQEATVVLGFPDIVFEADVPVLPHVLDALDASGADIMLGLFPTDRPEKGEMVEVSADGQVENIVIKSSTTNLRRGWTVAAWTPVFTSYLHSHLRDENPVDSEDLEEVQMGHVLQSALRADLDVRGVHIPGGRYIDIGTPDEFATYTTDQWG